MQKRRGFTTVELVIVIAVIAILAAVMIPTFSTVVKNANHNADIQTANALTQLVTLYAVNNDIEGESDIRDAINADLGDGFYESLAPKSGKYGYHFWYDIETNQFLVKTVAEIEALAMERDIQTQHFTSVVPLADGAEPPVAPAASVGSLWKESDKHFRNYNGFFMTDRGGSKVAEALTKVDKIGVEGFTLGNVLIELATVESANGDDKNFAASAAQKLGKTAVVAYGTFQPDGEIEHVYISMTAEELSATTTVINNATSLTVILPSNITKINSYSLQFNVDSILLVDATEEELAAMLSAYCVENCTITLSGIAGYEVLGSTVFPPENGTPLSLEISESSRVTDMTLSSNAGESVKFTELVPNNDGSYTLYVAVDYEGTLNFSVLDYYGVKELEDGTKEKIVAVGTMWAVGENSSITCNSAKDGEFVINGFAENHDAYAGTITATIQDVTKTIHVYGVKALGVSVDVSENVGLNIRDVDQNNVTITIPYTEGSAENNWSFVPSLVTNYTDTGIVLTGTIKVTDPAGALTHTNGVLSLVANYTDNTNTTLSVNFIDDEENVITTGDVSYKVMLINQGKESFAKDAHLTTYTKLTTFYVGNSGNIKLDYLFDAVKNIEGQKLFVSIYRGSTNVTPAPIAVDSLDGTINLSQLTTLDADYVIKICVGQEVLVDDKGTAETSDDVYDVVAAGAQTSVTVHLVNATNVTGDIGSISATNIVLLDDVTLNTAKSLTNVYGNLHKINSSLQTTASNFWDCLITLSGTMRDTLVIGPVYDTVGLEEINKEYCRDGVKLTGKAQIVNSYLFGFRAPVSVLGATDVKISNSVIEGGTYANIHVDDSKLTLENVKLIQKKDGYKATTKSNATVYGMGIFCDTDADCTIVLTGDTKQYNWTSVTDSKNVNTSFSLSDVMISISQIIENMINDGAGFVHSAVDDKGSSIVESDGTPRKYINLGIIQEIAYEGCDMSTPAHHITIFDQRTNKLEKNEDTIVYEIWLLVTTIYKYYDGYSYLSSGNSTIGPDDFFPAGWTSLVDDNGYCINYENFLNEQK